MQAKRFAFLGVMLLVFLVACTSGHIKYFMKQPYEKQTPLVRNLFTTVSATYGVVVVTDNSIRLEPVPLEEVNAPNNTLGYTYVLLDAEDGCGPSRMEMVNIAKDETAKLNAVWNKVGPLFLVESGFNAMRMQNGRCETITNPNSGATCMGQFLYSYHSHRDWQRIQNPSGEYENHIWCINQAITYLIEEANAGLQRDANAWTGWDPYWDGGVYRYKGCWHPDSINNGISDCQVYHNAELAGGYMDQDRFVSFAPEAVNTCWSFERNTWIEVDRSAGQTCLAENLKIIDNIQRTP